MAGNLTLGGQLGEINFAGNVIRDGTGRVTEKVTLAAGKAGTLSTRTDANTGVLTVGSGHGITTSNTIAIYWSGGARYGVTVSSTGATTINFDVGAGDDLPIATTAIVVCAETTLDMDFAGDEAIACAIEAGYRCLVELQQANGTSVLPVELNGTSGEVSGFWEWHSLTTGGTANPFAGVTVGKAVVSNGDSSNSNVVKIGVSKDSEI